MYIYYLVALKECKNDSCKNDGSCSIVENKIVCTCKTGFIGEFCELTVKENKQQVDASISQLLRSGIKMDESATKALDTLQKSLRLDSSVLTPEINKFLVGLSGDVNSKIVDKEISPAKAIFQLYDLGLIANKYYSY